MTVVQTMLPARYTVPLFVVVTFAVCCAKGVPQLPADMHEWSLTSIEAVYNDDFDAAIEASKRIQRKYPHHPAGYFFHAASLNAWMVYHESNARENEFYQYCSEAVQKAQLILDKGTDEPWVYFFLGGAEGLKGNYEMRYGRWITAFRYGWRGVSVLEKLKSKYREMADIDYGLGSYTYWRSAMGRVLKWLPGVTDERARGINLLIRAWRSGVYTKTASAAALVEIYRNEESYDSMLSVASEMIKRYPLSLQFQMGRAIALYGLNRVEDAERQFRILLARTERAPFENRYHAVIARFHLARIYYIQGRYASCISECEGIRRYPLARDIELRLATFIAQTKQMQQDAMRGHESLLQSTERSN